MPSTGTGWPSRFGDDRQCSSSELEEGLMPKHAFAHRTYLPPNQAVGVPGLRDRNASQPVFRSGAKLRMLRSVASLTKECANFNVSRFSTRWHIRNVPDKNAR